MGNPFKKIGGFLTNPIGSLVGGIGSSQAGKALGSLKTPDQQTSTTTNAPWEGLVPYLTGDKGILPLAKHLYNRGGPKYYPGDEVANLNTIQQDAIDASADRMNRDYSLLDDASQGILSFMNPSRDNFMEAYGDDIMDRVNSSVGLARRTGSGMHADIATKELGNVASRLHDADQNRKLSALGMLPGIESMRAGLENADINAALHAGGIRQGQQQNEINSRINRFNFNQNRPWDNLGRYAGIINQVQHGTGTQTTTQPLHKNPLGGALGGALAGSTFGPWGTAIGGGLGLLSSL